MNQIPQQRAQLTQKRAFWDVDSLDFSKDLVDWSKLTANERHFLSYILAFSASTNEQYISVNLVQSSSIQIVSPLRYEGNLIKRHLRSIAIVSELTRTWQWPCAFISVQVPALAIKEPSWTNVKSNGYEQVVGKIERTDILSASQQVSAQTALADNGGVKYVADTRLILQGDATLSRRRAAQFNFVCQFEIWLHR